LVFFFAGAVTSATTNTAGAIEEYGPLSGPVLGAHFFYLWRIMPVLKTATVIPCNVDRVVENCNIYEEKR
jgi:hypothetical protein